MKNIRIRILSLFFLPCSLLAQIPNADFELWELTSPFYTAEFPQQWDPPPMLGKQHYPLEKVSNPNMGQYAVLVKNNLPSPSSVGGAPGFLEVLFEPSSQHFRLSMEVRYDSLEPPGKAAIFLRGGGLLFAHWIDEQITEEMEVIHIEVELPEMFSFPLYFRIEARGVYNPDYGTPPFNGGYDGYAEIIVDNIAYENIVSTEEVLKKKDVHIYPNPASDAIRLKNETGETIQLIHIFNQTGELIRGIIPNGGEPLIDIRELSTGIYWLEAKLAGKCIIKQFVKK